MHTKAIMPVSKCPICGGVFLPKGFDFFKWAGEQVRVSKMSDPDRYERGLVADLPYDDSIGPALEQFRTERAAGMWGPVKAVE